MIEFRTLDNFSLDLGGKQVDFYRCTLMTAGDGEDCDRTVFAHTEMDAEKVFIHLAGVKFSVMKFLVDTENRSKVYMKFVYVKEVERINNELKVIFLGKDTKA